MNIIFSIIRLTHLPSQIPPPTPVFPTSYYPIFVKKEEDSGTCQHFNEICNLNQGDGGKSQGKVIYAYYLWVEASDPMVCGEYLQMEKACRLKQDDRLFRGKQQEKANGWQCD
jgi:hypothetical protein